MSMHIAIIGLNKIGASLGLALNQSRKEFRCIGYDNDTHIGRIAEKVKAVEKSYLSLPRCIKDANVIILANPVDDIKETLEVIADHAADETVVIDTSLVKAPVAAWANDCLPKGIFFTSWTLALNPKYLSSNQTGIDAAVPDLFENSLIGLVDYPGTPGEMMAVSGQLVKAVGAEAFYISAAEVDGLAAMGWQLPQVSALALLLAAVDAPGWHEAQKLASSGYAGGTWPALTLPEREVFGLSLQLNQANVTRLIDDMVRSLMHLRNQIESEEINALQESITHALEQRKLWLEMRQKMSWDRPDEAERLNIRRPSVIGNWLQSKFDQGKGRD